MIKSLYSVLQLFRCHYLLYSTKLICVYGFNIFELTVASQFRSVSAEHCAVNSIKGNNMLMFFDCKTYSRPLQVIGQCLLDNACTAGSHMRLDTEPIARIL